MDRKHAPARMRRVGSRGGYRGDLHRPLRRLHPWPPGNFYDVLDAAEGRSPRRGRSGRAAAGHHRARDAEAWPWSMYWVLTLTAILAVSSLARRASRRLVIYQVDPATLEAILRGLFEPEQFLPAPVPGYEDRTLPRGVRVDHSPRGAWPRSRRTAAISVWLDLAKVRAQTAGSAPCSRLRAPRISPSYSSASPLTMSVPLTGLLLNQPHTRAASRGVLDSITCAGDERGCNRNEPTSSLTWLSPALEETMPSGPDERRTGTIPKGRVPNRRRRRRAMPIAIQDNGCARGAEAHHGGSLSRRRRGMDVSLTAGSAAIPT